MLFTLSPQLHLIILQSRSLSAQSMNEMKSFFLHLHGEDGVAGGGGQVRELTWPRPASSAGSCRNNSFIISSSEYLMTSADDVFSSAQQKQCCCFSAQ